MSVFLTADLHLGHARVADDRGFASTDEHDRLVMANIVNTLSKGDHLWILGDVSSGTNRAENHALALLNELTPFFDLHLISGNHDSCSPYHVGSHIRSERFLEIFRSVNHLGRRKIPGVGKLWLSHFPYRGAGDRGEEERFSSVRIEDNGDWLAHGHLHTQQVWTGPRSIQVSLDAWDMKPVNIAHINHLIQQRAKDAA